MDNKSLENVYEILECSILNDSLAKKHLTKDIVAKYKNVETSFGGTLAKCLNTNAMNPAAMVCRATDPECFDTFSDYFIPLIKEYHKITSMEIVHPGADFGNLDRFSFQNLDPLGNFITSTRMQFLRMIKGYAFAPIITKKDRLLLTDKICAALSTLTGEFEGTYHSLDTLNQSKESEFLANDLMLRNDDVILRDAGVYFDWPSGRGIYVNGANTFAVWVNDEDHLRIIAWEKTADISKVYKRLLTGLEALGSKLVFERHKRLGYLTFCPTNLGTAIRANVHIKIPFLSALPNFKEICEKCNLQPRGVDGHSDSNIDGLYDLSNQRRLCLTEIQAAKEMYEGVFQIIKIEKMLMKSNKSTPNGIPYAESLEYLAKIIWNDPKNDTITKRHLSQEFVDKYHFIRTKKGSTLSHCIRNNAYNNTAECPLMGDAKCYICYLDYIDPIIREYHKLKDSEMKHPYVNYGDLDNLGFQSLDTEGSFVISTRVRVGRNIDGYNFPSTITKEDRLHLEAIIVKVFSSLTDEHTGVYHPIPGMKEHMMNDFLYERFLYKIDNKVLRDGGVYRDWPSGRGIFHSYEKKFFVWVGEEDHLRIISMQMGANLAEVYRRLVQGIQKIESRLIFAYSKKYGYLTSCPRNLGTSLKASVHIKIPRLSQDKRKLKSMCQRYKVQARSFEDASESIDGLYEISNTRRLGLTEYEAVMEMFKGVTEIIQMEKIYRLN